MGPPKLGFNSEGCVKENLQKTKTKVDYLYCVHHRVKRGVIIEYPVYAGRAPLEIGRSE